MTNKIIKLRPFNLTELSFILKFSQLFTWPDFFHNKIIFVGIFVPLLIEDNSLKIEPIKWKEIAFSDSKITNDEKKKYLLYSIDVCEKFNFSPEQIEELTIQILDLISDRDLEAIKNIKPNLIHVPKQIKTVPKAPQFKRIN